MKKTVKIAAVCAAVVTAISLSACAGNVTTTKTECKTGWDILQYNAKDIKTGETTAQNQAAFLSVTRNTVDGVTESVNEIWINVEALSVDEAKVFAVRYNSSDYSEYSSATYKKEATITREQVKAAKNGWIKIVSDYNLGYSYVKIGTSGGIKINEVVLINDKGEKMKYSVKAATMIIKAEDGTITSKEYYTTSEVEEMGLTESSPLFLNDEQDKFSK